MLTNRIKFLDQQATQDDLDDAWLFCKAMRAVGVIEPLEWRLRVLEDWVEACQEQLDCEGI